MKQNINLKMRIYHRYLGYFLAGTMTFYALSGVVLIYRNTDFLKRQEIVEKKLPTNLSELNLGKTLKIKNLKFNEQNGDLFIFDRGSYNQKTGVASYTVKKLPYILGKLTELHKASTENPFYWINLLFALSLLFFVVSSFFMYVPKSAIFKKGLYFVIGGLVFILILIFI